MKRHREDEDESTTNDARALDDQDLGSIVGAGRLLGTYGTTGWSWGPVSTSTTTYTDLQGNSFQTVTSGWGLSLPGGSASAGNVYAHDSAPADTSLRDVVLGDGWQGGFFDSTGLGSSGYTLESWGTPYLGLEHTNTVEIPGTARGPASAPDANAFGGFGPTAEQYGAFGESPLGGEGGYTTGGMFGGEGDFTTGGTDADVFDGFGPTGDSFGAFGESPLGGGGPDLGGGDVFDGFGPTGDSFGAFGESPLGGGVSDLGDLGGGGLGDFSDFSDFSDFGGGFGDFGF